ncbi:hypothetical protein G4G31_23480 [Massilia sp. Se16.2.3]|nr:hypothetical protein G4G31_23480 [Massilia sp. Se16.2.3]
MYQAVVGDEVQQAIRRHAGTDPLQGPGALGAEPDQGDGHAGEHDGIQVVLLEPAGTRLVVRAVPAPTETMHHVLVRDNGKHFHQHDGGKKDERIEQHGGEQNGSEKRVNRNDDSLPRRPLARLGFAATHFNTSTEDCPCFFVAH